MLLYLVSGYYEIPLMKWHFYPWYYLMNSFSYWRFELKAYCGKSTVKFFGYHSFSINSHCKYLSSVYFLAEFFQFMILKQMVLFFKSGLLCQYFCFLILTIILLHCLVEKVMGPSDLFLSFQFVKMNQVWMLLETYRLIKVNPFFCDTDHLQN